MDRTHLRRINSLLATLLFLSIITTAPGIQGNLTTDVGSDQQISIDSPPPLSLQELITNAEPNTTIQLGIGNYTEILTINKPLHLKGQGRECTFLHTISTLNGYAIRITAPHVIISDMTIINAGPGLYTTGIKISAPYTTIQNCRFADTPIGIALWSSQNTIKGCQFRGCDDEGIVLLGTAVTPCSNNTIDACTFIDNCDGVELQHAMYNYIVSCTFIQNNHAGIDAIGLQNDDNVIAHCTFSNNQCFGLYLAASTGNLISYCSFSDNSIVFINASNTILYKSSIKHLQLRENSSLLIYYCDDIKTSNIITYQSSYEIYLDNLEQQFSQKNINSLVGHSQILNLLSLYHSFQSFYERIRLLHI